MTVLYDSGQEPALFGREGELISFCVSVDPRLLEDLLETLAGLEFPVNPQLYHHRAQVCVEFPAYSTQLERIRNVLVRNGFDTESFTHQRGLARGQTP